MVRGADRLLDRFKQPASFAGVLVEGGPEPRPIFGWLRYSVDRYLYEDVGQTAGGTTGKVSGLSVSLQRLAASNYEDGVDLAMTEGKMESDPKEMPADYPNKLIAAVHRQLPQFPNETLLEPFEGVALGDRCVRTHGAILNLTRYFAVGGAWDRRDDWLLPPNYRWWGTGCLHASLANLSDRPQCPIFLELLNHGFEGDPERIDCLQLWFGKILTCPMFLGHQQFLSLYGIAGSGKSTICRVLNRLLGDDQVAELRPYFGGRFETSTLPGKRLVVFSETPDGVSSAFDPYMANVIKSITGQDRLIVEKKGRTPMSIRAEAEVLTIGNHPPIIPMEEGAFRRRAVFLRMSQPILNRDDDVERRMMAEELPGILLWGLEGAYRLHTGVKISTPSACKEDLEDASASGSPEERYVNTELVLKDNGRITPSQLYEHFQAWRRANNIGGAAGGQKKLAYLIREKYGIKSSPTHVNGKSTRVFLGLGFASPSF